MQERTFHLFKVGLAIFSLVLLAVAIAAGEEKMLYSFTPNDGHPPDGDLARDAAGNLFGTTSLGGQYHHGTVYQLTPDGLGGWTEQVLYSFAPGSGGSSPLGGVILDDAGNLYGTTCSGGSGGNGTVFLLSPDGDGNWTEQILYDFAQSGQGACPNGLIRDAAGNLYGTTIMGGSNDNGTAYELEADGNGTWTHKILHNFGNGHDGYYPVARMTWDSSGNLFGTTESGGSHPNCGTVFKLTANANGRWTEEVIHNFGFEDDGQSPEGGLVRDAAGNFYGTTAHGGSFNRGVAFRLTPKPGGGSTERVLHHFGYADDGQDPWAGLVWDDAGHLYGTTLYGGSHGYGTVFVLTPAMDGGSGERVLHHFGDGRDGQNPETTLIWDSNGNLYGTASYGGVHLYGAVFEVVP
ncbi:MAG: choice-of-anchor tandem repeat GloVer-containing protein [Candidatus Korobacteraceae bacterium]